MSEPLAEWECEYLLAGLLAEHVYQGVDDYGDTNVGLCNCGWQFPAGYEINDVQLWAAHVAAVITDAWALCDAEVRP